MGKIAWLQCDNDMKPESSDLSWQYTGPPHGVTALVHHTNKCPIKWGTPDKCIRVNKGRGPAKTTMISHKENTYLLTKIYFEICLTFSFEFLSWQANKYQTTLAINKTSLAEVSIKSYLCQTIPRITLS